MNHLVKFAKCPLKSASKVYFIKKFLLGKGEWEGFDLTDKFR